MNGRKKLNLDPKMSARPCGCDPGADHLCSQHTVTYFRDGQVVSEEEFRKGVKEVIIKDPTTGGLKGSKLARFDLVPPEANWALAEHYGKGCAKYEDRNWEKGYKWGLSVAALQRHLHQWLQGESYDPETGSHHLIAVAWHAFALFIFELRGLGTDDVRVKRQ